MTDIGHVPDAIAVAAPDSPASTPLAPFGYLREAVRIARFDDDAIGRMSKNRGALVYGAVIMAIGTLLAYAVALVGEGRNPAADPSSPVEVIAGAVFMVVAGLAGSALRVAFIHGLAKMVFGANGTFVGVLRVVWLASIVGWLAVVPVLGLIVAGVWMLILILVTFEQVDGVERLQALALVVLFKGADIVFSMLLA